MGQIRWLRCKTGGQGRGRTADLPLSGASAGTLHVAGRDPIGDLDLIWEQEATGSNLAIPTGPPGPRALWGWTWL